MKSDLNKDDEKKLLLQIASGDEQAFNILYRRYWDRLYNYLLRVTKFHEVSEEIATDVFFKLWTGREILPSIININGFLYKVTYNKAMDFFKKVAREKRIQEILLTQIEHATPNNADYILLDDENKQILQKLIQELSPQRRLVFSLNRLEGLSHEEIAQKLGLSRQTVKNTMSEAVKSICSSLKKNYPESYIIIMALISQ